MKLFGLGAAAPLVLGSAMLAIVGKESVTAEQAEAANTELTAAGIKGAQLITEAAFTELSEKAGRVDAAEATAKGFTDALAAAGAADMTALVAQRDGYKVKADKFDKGPGADHTTPTLEAGKTDVEQGEPNADQKAIDELPHNKALAGHPMFG
jgi:hypothetical protein